MVTSRIALLMKQTGRLIMIGAFSLIGIAGTQAMEVTPEQRAACTPDALRLCASEIPDVGRVTACMKANRASLSPRCQASFPGAAPSPDASVRQAAAPSRQGVVQGQRLADGRHAVSKPHYRAYGPVATHRHRDARPVVYAYHHHHHGWAQSQQAMAIAGQIMRGFGMACASRAIPADVCSMSGSFMGGGNMMGANLLGALERQ